jgi:hypothetical protein
MLIEDLGSSLPKPGSAVRFALAPRKSREAITGTGTVIRSDAARGSIALEFDPLPRATADELARVVFEQHQGGGSARRSARR